MNTALLAIAGPHDTDPQLEEKATAFAHHAFSALSCHFANVWRSTSLWREAVLA